MRRGCCPRSFVRERDGRRLPDGNIPTFTLGVAFVPDSRSHPPSSLIPRGPERRREKTGGGGKGYLMSFYPSITVTLSATRRGKRNRCIYIYIYVYARCVLSLVFLSTYCEILGSAKMRVGHNCDCPIRT